jgi:hypothetical protein
LVAYRRSEILGTVCGLLIGFAAIGGCVYLGVHGAQTTGSFLGTTGVTGLVSCFIVGRYSLAKQRQADFDRQIEATRIVAEQQRAAQSAQKQLT